MSTTICLSRPISAYQILSVPVETKPLRRKECSGLAAPSSFLRPPVLGPGSFGPDKASGRMKVRVVGMPSRFCCSLTQARTIAPSRGLTEELAP